MVITGCSSGIGLAAAIEFARQGRTVVATVRRVDRSEPLRHALRDAGVSAEIVALDVTDDASVRGALEVVAARVGPVEVIVSNAGVGIDGTTEELTVEDFRRSLDTNLLGSVRLLHAVLPAWRARGAGRFIAVGSTAGVIGTPFNDAYCASKFALEGLLESLSPVVAAYGIKISVVEPGPVAGQFERRSGPPAGRSGGPYAAARQRFQTAQDAGYATAQSPAEVAEVLCAVAAADQPLFRYQTGEGVARLIGVKLRDTTGERITALTSRWVETTGGPPRPVV